jgi:Tol biopolymer transport system component
LAQEDIQTLLRTAIQAAQSGNKAVARAILEQVIEQAPDNELAWIWLASVVETSAERRNCLQKVLAINPKNERARQALSRLERAMRSSKSEPQGFRAARTIELERDAVLKAHARRRQSRSPLLFMTVGLLAVAMIATGLILLLSKLQSQEENATLTATSGLVGAVPFSAGPTQLPGFVTSTPIGGSLRTLPPRETMPATWTPTATWTPSATPTLTATPPSLTSYTLLVSQKASGQDLWSLDTMPADGSDEHEISLRLPAAGDQTEPVLTLLEAYDAAFSPDGQQIAFTGRLGEAQATGGQTTAVEYEELFVAPASGGEVQRLTTFKANRVEDAAWSPDGKQIAIASDADGDFDVYVVPAEGGTPSVITRNKDDDREPAWSPDGKYLTFSSDRNSPGELEIWRMTVIGSELKQLTDNVNSSYGAFWAPDSQSIVFLSNRRVNTDLYIMTADGAGQRAVLVRDVPAEERDPAWSPDGEWIAFSSNREGAVFDLYLIHPDGTELQRVTHGEGDTRYVAWKP